MKYKIAVPNRLHFYGLDAGVLKLGFTSDGAFNPGINLGFLHAQAKVGLVNGADAGVDLGPLGNAGAGGYVGVDANGFKGNVGAGADALGIAGAGGHLDTRLGNATGVQAGGHAHLGRIGAGAGAGAAVGEGGLDAAAAAGVHAGRAADIHGGAHFGLGDHTQLAGAVGAHLAGLGGRTEAGVYGGDGGLRPDVIASGRAGYNHGTIDLNPSPYGDRYAQINANAPNDGGSSSGSGNRNEDLTQGHGLGKPASIEVSTLPPAHEEATPANIARVQGEIMTKLCHEASYTVHKGDTFKSIAAKLMPGADAASLGQEAQKLEQMHEANGYKNLKPGQKIATEDPYAIDRKARQAVAQHFGWAQS